MPSHTFTENDMLTIQVGVPPPGATALRIVCQFIPPPQFGPDPVRLLHLRRAGKGLKVAASEIVELLCKDGNYTAGFSGFGQKHAKAQPQHLGKTAGSPVDVLMTVPLVAGQQAVVAVEDLQGHAVPDLLAAGPLELLSGFSGPGDLKAPVGWSLLWDEHAITWVGADSPTAPSPPSPPLPPIIDPQVGPTPPVAPPVVGPPVVPPGTLGVPPDPRAIALAALLPALFPHLTAEQLAAASVFLPLLFQGDKK
jgi:hypothetical protein